MFEYVSPKKGLDKEEVKSRVVTVVLTLVGAAVLFGALYYATRSGW